jgi:hypothetical protein
MSNDRQSAGSGTAVTGDTAVREMQGTTLVHLADLLQELARQPWTTDAERAYIACLRASIWAEVNRRDEI